MTKAPEIPCRGIVDRAMKSQRAATQEAAERTRILEISKMTDEELKALGEKNAPRAQANGQEG